MFLFEIFSYVDAFLSKASPALACVRNHQRGNFRDCFVVQLSKFVATRLKQLVYFIKSEEVCQQLFSFIFKFLFDLTDSVLFRVVLADSLYIISSWI